MGITEEVCVAVKDEFENVQCMLGDSMFRGAPVTVTNEHHEIHCGDSYIASRTVDVSGSGTDVILIIVPDESPAYPSQSQKIFHMLLEGISESEGQWDLYEGPTVSANGTALNVLNRNRNSTNDDALSIYHTPTTSADGTLLESFHIGSGRGVGGGGRSDEWVLKNNTKYLVRFTNATAVANYITWRLNYYVHPGI